MVERRSQADAGGGNDRQAQGRSLGPALPRPFTAARDRDSVAVGFPVPAHGSGPLREQGYRLVDGLEAAWASAAALTLAAAAAASFSSRLRLAS